jgi:hypothetical protein
MTSERLGRIAAAGGILYFACLFTGFAVDTASGDQIR